MTSSSETPIITGTSAYQVLRDDERHSNRGQPEDNNVEDVAADDVAYGEVRLARSSGPSVTATSGGWCRNDDSQPDNQRRDTGSGHQPRAPHQQLGTNDQDDESSDHAEDGH